jgi:hypothetical protein
MKLPDFLKFPPLNDLKNRMGIPDDVYGTFSVEIDPGRLTPQELDLLTGKGIEVSYDQITILPDGTFAYKDNRVLLYIRDVHVFGNQKPEPKYHLSKCATIEKMFQSGRRERYVVSTKTNGNFHLNIIKAHKAIQDERHLSVCKNCLDCLSFKGFNSQTMNRNRKARFVAEFSPEHFFAVYSRSLHIEKPKYDSDTAPLNEYASNFGELSERLRRENAWRCQKCHRILSDPGHRRFLHVHHVNGVRSDNTRQNLKILCIACHADEANHSHMRKSPDYAEFSKLNRAR